MFEKGAGCIGCEFFNDCPLKFKRLDMLEIGYNNRIILHCEDLVKLWHRFFEIKEVLNENKKATE